MTINENTYLRTCVICKACIRSASAVCVSSKSKSNRSRLNPRCRPTTYYTSDSFRLDHLFARENHLGLTILVFHLIINKTNATVTEKSDAPWEDAVRWFIHSWGWSRFIGPGRSASRHYAVCRSLHHPLLGKFWFATFILTLSRLSWQHPSFENWKLWRSDRDWFVAREDDEKGGWYWFRESE